MDPRITLRDILLFEALKKKSFMDFNTAEPDDLCTLLYVHNQQDYHKYTLDTFVAANKAMFSRGKMDSDVRTFLKLIEADLKYVNQFSDKETANVMKNDDAEDHRLSPAILRLLYAGISPEWLMHQGMDMLPILTEGYSNKQQDDFANQRFWNIMLMSPHVKKGALTRLEHQLRTPNEKHQKEQVSEKENVGIFHAIFGKKKNS